MSTLMLDLITSGHVAGPPVSTLAIRQACAIAATGPEPLIRSYDQATTERLTEHLAGSYLVPDLPPHPRAPYLWVEHPHPNGHEPQLAVITQRSGRLTPNRIGVLITQARPDRIHPHLTDTLNSSIHHNQHHGTPHQWANVTVLYGSPDTRTQPVHLAAIISIAWNQQGQELGNAWRVFSPTPKGEQLVNQQIADNGVPGPVQAAHLALYTWAHLRLNVTP